MGAIHYHAVEEAISAIKQGGLVIVVDDEVRENEGDFVCAAETITPQMVDFMLQQGRGMLCVPVAAEIVHRLLLSEMVAGDRNTSKTQTPFLVMIDHRTSGTGVSAENRARTIRAVADPNSRPEDFVRPGHVPPLWAKDGGVLRRAGHTEATVDLMCMAGRQPAGVLIEILSPNGGGMADHQELQALSEKFAIPIVSIEALIRYRRTRECLIKREVQAELPTRYGGAKLIAYSVQHEEQVPLAIVWGDLHSVPAPWSACTRPVSRAICSPRCAATAATSCTWRWRRSATKGRVQSSTCPRKVVASACWRRFGPMPCRIRDTTRSRPTTCWATKPTCAIT